MFQYLVIYNIKKWPSIATRLPSKFNILPNRKSTVEKLPKTCKICQSGEISPTLVTLKNPTLGVSFKQRSQAEHEGRHWGTDSAKKNLFA